MKMPVLYMLLGIPGSGKSYFASQLAETTGALWLNSDKTRFEIYGAGWSERITDPKMRYDDVFSRMNKLMLETLQGGRDVLYDANNHKREFRDTFRNQAQSIGAQAILLYVKTPWNISDERATNRTNSPYQNPKMSPEKLQKHKDLFQEPQPDEITITVDGTLNFPQQYENFIAQISEVNQAKSK